VIKRFGALYVGPTGNGRHKLQFVFTVVTVEVSWQRHGCVLVKSSLVTFRDAKHMLI